MSFSSLCVLSVMLCSLENSFRSCTMKYLCQCVFCGVILCCVVSYYMFCGVTLLSGVILFYVVSLHVLLCHFVVWCNYMFCQYVVWCHFMFCGVILCSVVSLVSYIYLWCHFMFCSVTGIILYIYLWYNATVS